MCLEVDRFTAFYAAECVKKDPIVFNKVKNIFMMFFNFMR